MAGLSTNATIYLAVMVGIIFTMTALLVPALLWKKCPKCGARNMLDARECKRCKTTFPTDDGAAGGRQGSQS